MNLERTALPFLLAVFSLVGATALFAADAPTSSKLDYPKAKLVD